MDGAVHWPHPIDSINTRTKPFLLFHDPTHLTHTPPHPTKQEDLSELEDVTVVNLHESGLKATKFKVCGYVCICTCLIEWAGLTHVDVHRSSPLDISLTQPSQSSEQGLLEESRKASAEEDEEEAERQMERGADTSVAMVAGAGDEGGGKGNGKGGWRKYVMFWRKE